MTSLITKLKTAALGIVGLTMGLALAGLGLATIGVLSFFALLVVGVALICAPFASRPDGTPDSDPREDDSRVTS